ncbi:uncharacterized protein cubi_00179 [Cryptosporidium ubiquitum]|uniref:Chromatin assembly factor 1 subunit A dimerization domain-containing protein n=1 Tax=Cryptosporidium ubiquitum TaxID=857276 RepID=A0A1J4MK31_9CRYT|nr:uncharacterized protein cubi_00179 [Cryptosporidium ubiquitum]OII74626.1 hypothetical protein cubi_00179 [Cryptosporidium ubiquitum]
MIEKYPNLSNERINIENPIELLENEFTSEKKSLGNESNKYIGKEFHGVIPFEYNNGYGYLHTRLKWILDNNEINGQFKNEIYSFLETLGELRVLGVYNEPYKRYRRAFDTFSMKFDSCDDYNENIIGDLRYQCYQSSASGRKELKIIDRFIKEWSKRDRENKLLHSYRGAMSEWLNRSELGANKMESQMNNREDVFKEILDSLKDVNNLLQQSQILSFLSPSYISERLFPFMVGQTNNSTGALSCGIFGETIRSETPNLGGSLSSIELGTENVVEEDVAILIEGRPSSLRTEPVLEAIQKSNENSLSVNTNKNESVMNWIKGGFNRKQDSYGKPELIYDSIHKEMKKKILSDREKILSQRLGQKLCDIEKNVSTPSILNKDLIIKEYFRNYLSVYKIFISMRESLYKQRKYYKTIPTIGSIKYKRQGIELEEVRTRQFQSIYNDGIFSEPASKVRRVLIYRSEWKRPPMYLLITHRGRHCRGNNPLAKEDNINYDIDTDEEWEEQFGGEDVENIDDVPDVCEEDDDNDAVASGWLVPDGCFQSDELLDEFTIENSINDNGTNIVNLFSISSQYPSPVVISFLNHSSIDFGVGISIPNEEYVNSILKGYLIHFTQDFSCIYNKTDLSGYLSITPDESKSLISSNTSEILSKKKSVLDLQLKQDLSYFIHGKWASIRKIIEEFFEVYNYKDIKKASVIHFIKENVRKAKLEGDVRSRWYVNENNTSLELDFRKLSELLLQRKGEEKNLLSKVEPTKIRQNRAYLQSDTSPNLKSQAQFPENSQNSNSNGKGKLPSSCKYLSDADPEYPVNYKIVSEDNENGNINSQFGIKMTGGTLNFISSSQGSEQPSFRGQAIEKETHTRTAHNNKKRKCSTPIRIASKSHSDCSTNQEKKKNGIDGLDSIKTSTPDSKSYAHLYNNSLITHFFPPKIKD